MSFPGEFCNDGCPADYIESDGRCYRAFTTPKTWDDAEADCVAEGGNLASIENEAEQWVYRGVLG